MRAKEVSEADCEKCQWCASCSPCSCMNTDDFCCDLGSRMSWADFTWGSKQGWTRCFRQHCWGKRTINAARATKRKRRKIYFILSWDCWLKELTFKAWLVKIYSNTCFCKAFEYRQSEKLLPVWQQESMYKIARLFQTISGTLPVTLLARMMKKDAA